MTRKLSAAGLALVPVLLIAACTREQGAAGAKVATTIADATCRELATTADAPDWITLACAAEGVASGVVNVRMRRTEWLARRGACARGSLDAGPGL
jgi:hypothetical protein